MIKFQVKTVGLLLNSNVANQATGFCTSWYKLTNQNGTKSCNLIGYGPQCPYKLLSENQIVPHVTHLTVRTKSPGLLWLSLTRKLPFFPLSNIMVSASLPDIWPWNHLETTKTAVRLTQYLMVYCYFFSIFICFLQTQHYY